MPTLPNRALRVSMPLSRKLLLDSRPPAMDSVISLRPVHEVAGEVADSDGNRARSDSGELNEVPATQRQVHDRLVVHHLADSGALAVEQRVGGRRDGHGLGRTAPAP